MPIKDKHKYNCKANIFLDMCFYLGRKLRINPYSIYEDWDFRKVICSFGYYANNESISNYEMWSKQENKNIGERPTEYIVYFIDYYEDIYDII